MVEVYRKGWFKDGSIKNFRLARARKYRNLKMGELAEKAGITLSYYSGIEYMRHYPTPAIRKKISSILKENADYLFPERFRLYYSEHRREMDGISEDVLDNLNRVKFSAKACRRIPDNEDFLEALEVKDREEHIENLLNNLDLPEITRKVFYSRFGFEGRAFYTLEELGKIFHVTKERIRQRELRVLEELQHPARLKRLKEFL